MVKQTNILTDAEIVGLAYKRDGQPEITLMRLFARAIEQAVLQSPEVHAWKKDAERYRWLLDQIPCNIADALGCAIPDIDLTLDDAMEKQL